jgi:glycosyltransferase involved in cell wall biosynthesis
MHTTGQTSSSICICARNRPDELRRALTSVSQSSLAPKQVVVSDDSDDDRVASVVADYPIPIIYTRGPRSGLGANRNHAISFATGASVIFMDDDATLGSEFLRTMEDCLGGMSPQRRATAIVTGVEMKAGRTIIPNKQGFLGFQSRPYRKGERLQTVNINATRFPLGLFDKVLFDPQLKYGYDEVDLTTQAVALGFEIVPCFTATNYHYPSPVGRAQYEAFAEASRLYVTLKRRRWTEGSSLRAWPGLVLAVIHLYLASAKRSGFIGCGEAGRAVSQAWAYYTNFVESTPAARRGGPM